MYYTSPRAGERFSLRTLLTAIKGATSFESLRTFGDYVCATYREACIMHGLLEDDNEWRLCLQKAGDMASGHQLHNLFVIILCDCSPSDLLALWMQFHDKICDDLIYALEHHNLQVDPTQEDVFDYGLYLIDCILQKSNQSLREWPELPFPVGNWAELIGNPLIREQHYNQDEQAALAAENIPCLNQGQRAAFDEIVKAVDEQSGQTFFFHGPGGTGKTFTYKILCYHFRSKGKIVLCVASSGIAALLLIGGRTAHSCFKISLKIHEESVCSFPKW